MPFVQGKTINKGTVYTIRNKGTLLGYPFKDDKDPHTLLLLHGEDLTDSSLYSRDISVVGVSASNAKKKFGTKSLYFDGASFLSITSQDFILGEKDFTIDWWENRTVASTGTSVAINRSTADGYCNLLLSHKGGYVFAGNGGGGWDILSNVLAWPSAVNTWVHKCLVRSGNSLLIFNNGNIVYTGNISVALNVGTGECFLGRHAAPSNPDFLNGYIDEFRVSDVARWTENFVPPTSPYSS